MTKYTKFSSLLTEVYIFWLKEWFGDPLVAGTRISLSRGTLSFNYWELNQQLRENPKIPIGFHIALSSIQIDSARKTTAGFLGQSSHLLFRISCRRSVRLLLKTTWRKDHRLGLTRILWWSMQLVYKTYCLINPTYCIWES